MRKIKRIVALVLTLAMVFCFMALSASAAATEIQPRGTCPQCINGYVTSWVETAKPLESYGNRTTGYNECGNMSMPHRHYLNVKYNVLVDCNNCTYNGTSYSYTVPEVCIWG